MLRKFVKEFNGGHSTPETVNAGTTIVIISLTIVLKMVSNDG